MDEERSIRRTLRKIVPRLLKAAFWSFLMGGEALFFFLLPGFNEYLSTIFPVDKPFFLGILAIFVLFEVAIQLLSGTILKYVLSITRALISMIYLVFITNCGIITMSIPSEMVPYGGIISFTVEFRAILSIFLIFSLISILKNIIQAITFLSERAELPYIFPEIP